MASQQLQTAVVVDTNDQKSETSIRVAQVPHPGEPGKGEALVRVTLRPVNPSDVLSIQGLYQGFAPQRFPAVVGGEAVGVVERVGPGVTKVKPGQRVVAVPWNQTRGDGTWQQFSVLKESVLIPVPDSVSDESASQFLINPVTVFGLLEQLEVPRGEFVISTAAGSTLGRMAIQYAKEKGINIVGIVRRKEQAEELLKLGAHTVLTQGEDLKARVREVTGGKGAWGAIDAVGGGVTSKVGAALRKGGTVLVYGFLEGDEARVAIADLVFSGVRVQGFWLVTWLGELGDKAAAKLSEVMDALAKGVIQPYSGKKFPLAEAQAAVKASLEKGREGKVFLAS